MNARLQDLPFDPVTLNRLSPGLITSHHQNNYGGAVKRLNAIRAELATTAFATAHGFQLNGLKREELIATNSMLLHELYFGSLGGDGESMEPAMQLALDQARTTIPGARWCDPAAGSTWSAELPADRRLVVYCVHGHEVSRAVAMRLRAAGLNARFLRAGLAGWQAAGRPLADKPAGQTE
jgi:rhodanese-related sulfurtransferase